MADIIELELKNDKAPEEKSAEDAYRESMERIRDFLTACYYLAQATGMTVGELYDAFCEGKKETGALIGRKLDELLAEQRKKDSEESPAETD